MDGMQEVDLGEVWAEIDFDVPARDVDVGISRAGAFQRDRNVNIQRRLLPRVQSCDGHVALNVVVVVVVMVVVVVVVAAVAVAVARVAC